LVVAAGVDDQVAQEFAGRGVDDADVEALVDEKGDVGSGVGSAHVDVAESAGAQGTFAEGPT
jgi:hypothetical protein